MKYVMSLFTKILFALFMIGTLISLFIAYKQIDSRIAFIFLEGYTCLAIFLLLYIPAITILNSRKLKFSEIRRRIFKFIALFVLAGILNYGFDYFFRPLKIELARELTIAFGFAFGGTFIDIALSSKDNGRLTKEK